MRYASDSLRCTTNVCLEHMVSIQQTEKKRGFKVNRDGRWEEWNNDDKADKPEDAEAFLFVSVGACKVPTLPLRSNLAHRLSPQVVIQSKYHGYLRVTIYGNSLTNNLADATRFTVVWAIVVEAIDPTVLSIVLMKTWLYSALGRLPIVSIPEEDWSVHLPRVCRRRSICRWACAIWNQWFLCQWLKSVDSIQAATYQRMGSGRVVVVYTHTPKMVRTEVCCQGSWWCFDCSVLGCDSNLCNPFS